jgi:hypothetical protein
MIKRKSDIRADKGEKLKRIRIIQEYLVLGKNPKDIVVQVSNQWNISPRMAYSYLNKAFEDFRVMSGKDVESLRGFHITARLKLLDWAMDSDKRKTFALEVLQDIAKLQGLYTIKVDHTSGGKEIQFAGIEIIAPSPNEEIQA